MTTITIPLNNDLNDFVEEQVKLGNASSKAELVRRAIIKYKEDEFINAVLKAKQEIKEGKVLTGTLDDLAQGFE